MLDVEGLGLRVRSLTPQQHHAVTLPDFFLDHFIYAPPWDKAVPAWKTVHDRGGGNVPMPGQHMGPGGNAANTALALARLGVRTHLVSRTSPFGKTYLEQTLGHHGVDLRHVRSDGLLAVTTAIEFHDAAHPRNVMLSDPGSVATFGPDSLTPNDWTLIEAADIVLVANWSQNRSGTALVEAVTRASSRGGRMAMLDTGDPSVRPGSVEELRARVIPLPALKVYALNENELRQVAGQPLDTAGEQRAAAAALCAQRAGGMVDLHTASFAASYDPKGETFVPTFAVKPLRVTGAGDAWNAGNMLGHVSGLPPELRLGLANAVAATFITNPAGLPPTLAEVVAFLEAKPPFTAVG